MSPYFNIASLLLGLLAWIIPVVTMNQASKRSTSPKPHSVLLSFGACVLALWFQIKEVQHRVNISDWSALMDTIGAIANVALVLIVVTLILNAIALASISEKAKR